MSRLPISSSMTAGEAYGFTDVLSDRPAGRSATATRR